MSDKIPHPETQGIPYEDEPLYLLDGWKLAVYKYGEELRDDWKKYYDFKDWMVMVFGSEEIIVAGRSVSYYRVGLEVLFYGKKGTERPYQIDIEDV